jgi:hypothetical protein
MATQHPKARRVSALPPVRFVEQADLAPLGHLLPPAAVTLLRVLGPVPALALLRAWPGVQVPVPKHPDKRAGGVRRWAEIAEVVGDAAMPALAGHWGGSLLDIPLCTHLLAEKRNRWLRERFDELTNVRGAGISGYHAIQELCLALAEAGQPLNYREVQRVLQREDALAAERDARAAQGALFTSTTADH